MKPKVEIDVVLPHPPERVWRALTDPDRLAEWLMPNDFQPRIGFRFGFQPAGGRNKGITSPVRCEVVELEPPSRLAYSWSENPDALPDLITWTLEPVDAGTRLRLEHCRPEPANEPAVTAQASTTVMAVSTSTLWCGAAIRLERFLAGRLVMGRAVAVSGGDPVRAVASRRIVSTMRGNIRC